MENIIMEPLQQTNLVITPAELLAHWQDHRNLTRRVIEAFPEDKLFSYSAGGMRPFAEMAIEMIGMAVPGLNGVITGKWEDAYELPHHSGKTKPSTKKELLKVWDEVTAKINALWPQIPAHRFQEHDLAFGQWEGPVYFFILYWIDNEIHHRAQGYVYLRTLGIEPPHFWERQ
ncbi:damage-inducible protein DinB [Panacibacter ginsenosidivorans]|uniref:Damage-inducible protein DinB n=1 Tax=Panacibacter ginsenosidivorans TaxID=1813871 RepID=A0A5B8VFK4_9BACT|nr:DinB family protein [Panacibacter ginsenosidivorans]QEC69128.1 damage-inducible protein DinB [Panacibacter ginsenosidivorans]